MPTPTYDLIASNVLSSSASSVTFSSIPATYRDLVLVCNTLGAAGFIQINSDTGSNYPAVVMYGNGTTAASYTETPAFFNFSESNGLGRVQFFDYSATDKHKSILVRNDKAADFAYASTVRWANTSAITSIYIYNRFSVNFSAGSTFYLYGIAS